MLLSEIEKEEKERHWYYSQLQSLSQKLNELPRLDTVSIFHPNLLTDSLMVPMAKIDCSEFSSVI